MLVSLKPIFTVLERINRKTHIEMKRKILEENLEDPIFGDTLRKVLIYLSGESWNFKLKKINFCVYFDDAIALEHQNVESIFKMLEFINDKDGDISDDEISFLEKISSSDPETIEVVTRILNKESGCGLTKDRKSVV